jgi:hypothetical protein
MECCTLEMVACSGRSAVAERREDLRAADVDRQFVAERLKSALDEGRLSLSEYDERLRDAYASKTYGDLDKVLADLPGFTPLVEGSQVAPAPAIYPTAAARQEISGRPLRAVPSWLLRIWSAWLVAVSVTMVIWVLTSISAGELLYFWPMWVAGPWGAVLVVATIGGLSRGEPHRWAEREARKRERKRRRDY